MTNLLINANSSRIPLKDNSVQCVVTSPPYFGLRSYGVGAENGEIGIEQTVDEYVASMVSVFKEVHRVLKDDGVVWLNLGDSYNGSGGAGGDYGPGGIKEGQPRYPGRNDKKLKPKDLCLIPARIAIALQEFGYWIRADVIWEKRNCMPDSARDRPTRSHEYIYLLSKSASYYYDAEAIYEEAAYDGRKDTSFKGSPKYEKEGISARTSGERWPRNLRTGATGEPHSGYTNPDGSLRIKMKDGIPARNKRTVWTVSTVAYKGAHFATYPEKLIEPCILAGSRPGDIILDPFNGAGTTGLVSRRLDRHYIGLDINLDYVKLSQERWQHKALKEWQDGKRVEDVDDLGPLFGGIYES